MKMPWWLIVYVLGALKVAGLFLVFLWQEGDYRGWRDVVGGVLLVALWPLALAFILWLRYAPEPSPGGAS